MQTQWRLFCYYFFHIYQCKPKCYLPVNMTVLYCKPECYLPVNMTVLYCKHDCYLL